jgi:hypothetical protein
VQLALTIRVVLSLRAKHLASSEQTLSCAEMLHFVQHDTGAVSRHAA